MAQLFNGDVVLRAFGVSAVKSAELSSVSVQPLFPLSTAVVLLGAGVDPEPSKQLAVVPNPTKSMIEESEGHASVRAVVLLTSATFPAVADMAIVPVASSSISTVPPEPAAS